MSSEREKWPVKRLIHYLKRCLTPADLAKRCKIPKRTIYNWLEDGRLGYIKIGNRMYVPLDQLIELDHVPATRSVVCRVLCLSSRPARPPGDSGTTRAQG